MISVYLDANILITAFEENSPTNALVWSILNAIESGAMEGITSQITPVEVLPKPLANGQGDLVRVHEDLLSSESFLDVRSVTPETLTLAARIRAERLSIKLPDSIHLASARRAHCHAIFSSDKRLVTPMGPPVIEPVPGCLELLRALAP